MITHWKSFWEGEKIKKSSKSQKKKQEEIIIQITFLVTFFQKSISSDVWIMKKIFSRRDPLISLGGNPNPSTTEKEPIKVKIYIKKKFFVENFYLKKEICSNKSYLNILSNKSSNISTGLILKSLFCTEIWLKLPWEQK